MSPPKPPGMLTPSIPCSKLPSASCLLSFRHPGIHQYSSGPGQHSRRGQRTLPRDEREGGAVWISKYWQRLGQPELDFSCIFLSALNRAEKTLNVSGRQSGCFCWLRETISLLLIGNQLALFTGPKLLRQYFIDMPSHLHYQVNTKFTSVKNPIFLVEWELFLK